ncbi:MAG: FKBP-type peptidyl-prolyl cis-trans isomerase [Bacteroidales bacterium]|nr:FKBP-type peptidyl-prolyl cis-trans isomerase [Bacteroidales bacterium]
MNFRNLLILAVLVVFIGACSKSTNIGKSAKIKSELDTVSYALGADVANSLQTRNGVDELSYTAFMKGMQQVFDGEEVMLDDTERQSKIRAYLEELSQKRNQENLEAGKKFLEENKSKEGVKVTESGLQYKVIEEGTGISPDANDTVKVHYVGKTIDGEVFDSSKERGEPAEFPVNRVISGWTEGLQMMKEGANYKLFIPTDLAYGTRVRPGGEIEPNEALIFDVELLEVTKVEGEGQEQSQQGQ